MKPLNLVVFPLWGVWETVSDRSYTRDFFSSPLPSLGPSHYVCVWFQRLSFSFAFCFFFLFFFLHTFQGTSATEEYCSVLFGQVFLTLLSISGPVHCSWTHKFHFFINFFIKNEFHSTIHTLKNYFATVFSVFNFQFSVSAK